MSKNHSRRTQLLFAALVAGLAFGASAAHANAVVLEKIAVAGDVAPGAGGAQHASSFFSVSLNGQGEVAFANDITGAAPNWGVFLYGPAGNAALSLVGDMAPDTGGGSYFLAGGFTAMNDSAEVSFMAATTGGSAGSGIFRDSGGGDDSSIVVAGQPAPGTGGGEFDGGLNTLNFHSMNAAGVVVFADTVTGGATGSGVFRNTSGVHSAVSVEGDVAPATGGVYDGFQSPVVNDGGDVVFPAYVVGGSAGNGLFRDSGGVDSMLALAGDPAPGTGGGTFLDFLFPDQNAGGDVAFLANVTGGTATGGVFRIVGGVVSAVAVEHETAPGTGGGSFAIVTSLAPINASGDIAFSAALNGGSYDAGVFRFDASTGSNVPVVLFGDSAPESSGATFAQFGFLDLNDAGRIAFQTTLSDGNLGLYLASPAIPVPAIPPGAFVPLAAGLLACAWAFRRRPAA